MKIILIENVKVTGSGTQSDPYVMNQGLNKVQDKEFKKLGSFFFIVLCFYGIILGKK